MKLQQVLITHIQYGTLFDQARKQMPLQVSVPIYNDLQGKVGLAIWARVGSHVMRALK